MSDVKYTEGWFHRLVLGPYKVQKEVKSMQKQPGCEKMLQPSKSWVKICEIKGGGQEMAAMMLMLINFNSSIIAAISWLPPLISQHFFTESHNFFPPWMIWCE